MKRSSGVLMHISSLWGDYKIGSFGAEAKEFVDFLTQCGFSYWQVLPFCMPDECNSPYKSFGAFSGNHLLYKHLIVNRQASQNRDNILCLWET